MSHSHHCGSTCHPGGVSAHEADGASLSRSLQKRESQGWVMDKGPAFSSASEMKDCRPRGIFHSVKSHAVTVGLGAGFSMVLRFFSKLLLRVISCCYTKNLSIHKFLCSNIRFYLFPPPQRRPTTLPNGSTSSTWKLNLTSLRRQ